MLETLMCFAEGAKECNHDWLYSKPENLNMSYPIESCCVRVCSACGRMERIKSDKILKPNRDFNKVFNKFIKGE